MNTVSSYNQRLFSGMVRGRLHRMRFHWLKRNVPEKENQYTLFELGCFDCRSLGFVAKPSRYVGADAGWEGGIEDARMNYNKIPWIELVTARSFHDLERYQNQQFDYSIALETLQYIPDALLRGYIEFLAQITRKKLLITVPVEVGPVFLVKYLMKKMFSKLESPETNTYTLSEIYWATCGRADRVRRYEHKGFDYRELIKLIGEYFHVTRVEGLPFANMPYLSFEVGIIAEPRLKNL